MNVFITGGTGFIGSAVVRELRAAGHAVVGLARTPESDAKLAAAGAGAQRGELTDTAPWLNAMTRADAVIHCGFIHDFANFAASVRTDLLATQAMLDALAAAGGKKIFVNTSGTATIANGREGVETSAGDASLATGHRVPAERATIDAAARGVRSAVMRLPPSVHGDGDRGFIPILVATARKTGVAAYPRDGANRWPAVHRDDAATLYRLAVEALASGAVPAGSILHGVGDAGVPMREIAGAIGERLGLPVEPRPADHFGWFATFAAMDNPMSSALTRQRTGWHPARPGLIADLRSTDYDELFAAP